MSQRTSQQHIPHQTQRPVSVQLESAPDEVGYDSKRYALAEKRYAAYLREEVGRRQRWDRVRRWGFKAAFKAAVCITGFAATVAAVKLYDTWYDEAKASAGVRPPLAVTLDRQSAVPAIVRQNAASQVHIINREEAAVDVETHAVKVQAGKYLAPSSIVQSADGRSVNCDGTILSSDVGFAVASPDAMAPAAHLALIQIPENLFPEQPAVPLASRPLAASSGSVAYMNLTDRRVSPEPVVQPVTMIGTGDLNGRYAVTELGAGNPGDQAVRSDASKLIGASVLNSEGGLAGMVLSSKFTDPKTVREEFNLDIKVVSGDQELALLYVADTTTSDVYGMMNGQPAFRTNC